MVRGGLVATLILHIILDLLAPQPTKEPDCRIQKSNDGRANDKYVHLLSPGTRGNATEIGETRLDTLGLQAPLCVQKNPGTYEQIIALGAPARMGRGFGIANGAMSANR